MHTHQKLEYTHYIVKAETKMSEAEKNIDGCIFCQIGQNEVPETELLYDDIDYAVFRFVFNCLIM